LSSLESQSAKTEALTRDLDSYDILITAVKRLQRDLDQLEAANTFLADSLIDVRATLRGHGTQLSHLQPPEAEFESEEGEFEFESEEGEFDEPSESVLDIEREQHNLDKLVAKCVKAYRRERETLSPNLHDQIQASKAEVVVDREAIRKCLKKKIEEGLGDKESIKACTPK
jgi:hypothetical protein